MRGTKLWVAAVAVAITACAPSTTSSSPSGAAVAANAPSPSTASGAPSFATTSSPPGSASVAPLRVFGSYGAAPMIHGRVGFDAVLLGDGTVLAIGDDMDCYPGGASEGSERAESYDPATDTWTEEDSLNKPRKLPATVVLQDGSAMVIGGLNSDDEAFSSTKVFSPATRSWTDGPLLAVARATPHAAVLVDERVLVVDWQGSRSRTTSEIYEPQTGRWSAAASLPREIDVETMITIPPLQGSFEGAPREAGEVLALGRKVAGDDAIHSLHIYDRTYEEWGVGEPPNAANGTTFVALAGGGAISLGGWEQGRSVQRLDPEGHEWSDAAPMSTERTSMTVVALADGRILVAGGTSTLSNDAVALKSTEIYDPKSDRWTPGPDLREPRRDAHGVLLQDGSVLILGGNASFNTVGDVPWCPSPLTSVERLYVGTGS